MRNMMMCALISLIMASAGLSQSTSVENLVLKIYDEKNELISSETFEDEEAAKIDVVELIRSHQDQARINIRGLFYTDLEVNRIKFDSKEITDFNDAENFCPTVDFTLKPYLGVGVYSVDDMNGVNVERVVSTSPAGQAGIQEGDIILTFNYMPISSYCDLKMYVAETKVGDEVPVVIIRNGREIAIMLVIGGQVNNTITYHVCDEPIKSISIENEKTEFDFSELNVYPNPTTDFVNLKFISTSSEPIKFYVLNFNGAIVHAENVTSDAGAIKLSYAFANESDGTYLFVIEQGDKLFEKQVIYMK